MLDVRSSTLNVRRSALKIQGSSFSLRRSTFSLQRSTFMLAMCAGLFVPGFSGTSLPSGLHRTAVATSPAEIIDRILAVVFMQPILLSDVNAAMRLQLVPATPGASDPIAATLDRLIGRTLMLAEVDRYQPPEPAGAEIDSRLADIERRLGSAKDLDSALAATGMTRDRLRQYLRDDLRIATYLNQRFGAAAQPSDADVLAYYREHPAEFTTGAALQPLEAVAGTIRSRLAEGHRTTLIADWLAALRRRADVTVLYLGK